MPEPLPEVRRKGTQPWWERFPWAKAGIPPLGLAQLLAQSRTGFQAWKPTEGAWWTGQAPMGTPSPEYEPWNQQWGGAPFQITAPFTQEMMNAPAGGQPAKAGFDLTKAVEIAPGVLQMLDGSLWSVEGYRLSPQYAESIINRYNQQLGGGGAGQVPSWVTANQQAVMRSMARQYSGMERQIEEAQRGQMQAQWESQRQQMLGQLNEPQDWIKRWMLQQKSNPYKRRQQTPDENVAQISQELAQTIEGGPEAFRDLIDPYGESSGEFDTETEMRISDAYRDQLKNLEGQLKQAEKDVASWGGPEPRKKGGTPPTPPWLAQWYPEQLQAGQPIKKLPIATPSMQWWQSQPESARQGWLGFAEFSGATPMDVMSEMQRQLTQPRQPRQRSIARQRTWV